MMTAEQLWFVNPYQLEVRAQQLPPLQAGQMRVHSVCSGISAGTEMLVYRGQLPSELAVDATLEGLQMQANYPLPYGYACVGRVEALGEGVAASWMGQLVFAFQTHASAFITTPEQVIKVPEDINPEAAIFLANMETAVNMVLDGQPSLGEQVVVLGQGIVGLLLTSILRQYPLAGLYALDGLSERRAASVSLGSHQVLDPFSEQQLESLKHELQLPLDLSATVGRGADLVYEVTGSPTALNLAITLCSYSGRIVIGSWYGNKLSLLNLGGVAHRNRIKLISSQVSTIAPELSGRWDKERRFQTAWDMIRRLNPESLITHKLPLAEAAQIYRLIDQAPEQVLQAVFIY